MGRKQLKIKVKGLGKPKKIARFLDDGPERARSALRQVARQMAANALDDVQSRIPDDGGMQTLYKSALRMRDVLGLGEDEFAVVVTGESVVSFESVDASKVVVVFRTIRGGEETAAASILRHYSPWAVDVIPAVQGGIRANAILKVASASEIEDIREKNRKERGLVEALLARRGISITSGPPKLNGKAMIDLAFLALRLEKGLGGFKPRPHWTPAILNARTRGLKELANNSEFVKHFERTLSDPKYQAWKADLDDMPETVKKNVAGKTDGSISRLGS